MKILFRFIKDVTLLVVLIFIFVGDGVNRVGIHEPSVKRVKVKKHRPLKKSVKKYTKIRKKGNKVHYKITKTTNYWR